MDYLCFCSVAQNCDRLRDGPEWRNVGKGRAQKKLSGQKGE